MDLSKYTLDQSALPDLLPARTERRVNKQAKSKAVPQVVPRHRKGERFICGPLPLPWFKIASGVRGRAEAVALLIWYAAGLHKSNTIKLKHGLLAEFEVHPKTGRQILRRFQELGLVEVEFRRGRSPLVTIIQPDSSPSAD